MKRMVFLLLLLIIGLAEPGMASSTDDMQYVEVYVRQKDGATEIVSSGRISQTQILVPAFIFPTHIAPGTSSFDEKSGRLKLAVSKPDWQLETAKLDANLKSGVTLNFLATLHENEYFVNIKNMEKILGIRLRHDQEAGRLYIERGASFADKQLNKVRPAWSPKGKLNLVWDYIPRFSPDLTKQATISGLDVISPTWFSISADGRLLINNANLKYVQDAHAKGYKVWPLFKNGDFDPDLTKEFLASETMQDLIISQLLVYTALYDLDGINIDFEDVYEEDRDRLTGFVKRLADALREQNVISSVDVTVPGPSPNWSKCYDRKGLAQAVDYVMVMTYDEHWGASPVAGPVSSLGWVDRNLDLIINNYIPREKLVMGIPFYTREWRETIDEHGKVKVRSKAYGMDDIQKTLEEHNLKPIWLDDKGLFYTEYKKDGSLYRIWLEDEKSIAKKAALVKKYDLAGAASWRKGFEAPHIWPVLEKELKAKPKVSKK
ncbi:hypothetical protein AXX12_06190 [Anaerosporomusa subterranea]|uniref:GH18 domain-containing protein n=2 Tax=Anaerosporomusa subterranea TaxID=1794912 RepID=A0A154BQ45_ANASB|nr:hypothetical protein AXX12_06190 [Anaerosporomusa subterranea]